MKLQAEVVGLAVFDAQHYGEPDSVTVELQVWSNSHIAYERSSFSLPWEKKDAPMIGDEFVIEVNPA